MSLASNTWIGASRQEVSVTAAEMQRLDVVYSVGAIAIGNGVRHGVDTGAGARDGVVRLVAGEHSGVVPGIAGFGTAPDNVVAATTFHRVVAAISANGVARLAPVKWSSALGPLTSVTFAARSMWT